MMAETPMHRLTISLLPGKISKVMITTSRSLGMTIVPNADGRMRRCGHCQLASGLNILFPSCRDDGATGVALQVTSQNAPMSTSVAVSSDFRGCIKP